MMISRRNVVAGLGAGLGAAALTGLPSVSYSKTSMPIGTGELISVSDGNLVLPGDMVFAHLPQDEVSQIIENAGVSRDQVMPPCNLTLFRDGENLVLFDAGSGGGFMPSAGQLLSSLDAVGVSPDQITHVIFTHAHPDHIWGVLDDFDDLVFPDAQHMIGRAEYDYWSDPQTIQSISPDRQSFAVGAARRLEALESNLSFINNDQEVLSGIMAHATFGHTPGHMSFEIRSGSTAVMVGGDAIVNHHVAFARPDWAGGSDQDPDTGAATRTRLLDQLVADDIALMGFHLPQGGLGRVERANGAYRFIAGDV